MNERLEDAPIEEWTQAWLAECDARIAAAEEGTEPAAPWDEVYRRLRGRLGSMSNT